MSLKYMYIYICIYHVILLLGAPEFGETHSSVLGCKRRPVSASIISRSCFPSFPVCVYKYSSHHHNNIMFYRQQFGASSDRITLYIYIYIYRWSQEECARIREGVPYVKVYRYNPKHLCPKLNGYGDNGQRKVWSSGGYMHCTCQLTSLIDVCP